jgi:hypothetical protein
MRANKVDLMLFTEEAGVIVELSIMDDMVGRNVSWYWLTLTDLSMCYMCVCMNYVPFKLGFDAWCGFIKLRLGYFLLNCATIFFWLLHIWFDFWLIIGAKLVRYEKYVKWLKKAQPTSSCPLDDRFGVPNKVSANTLIPPFLPKSNRHNWTKKQEQFERWRWCCLHLETRYLKFDL